MLTKLQTRVFPLSYLGILKSITVKANKTGDTVNINYPDLKLVVQNNQLCWFYESSDGDLIMPIARRNTIDKLFKNEN